MRKVRIYLPAMSEYDGIVLTAIPNEKYNAKETAEGLLDFLDELPHGVIRELFQHPRFELTKRSAQPLNERKLERSLNSRD